MSCVFFLILSLSECMSAQNRWIDSEEDKWTGIRGVTPARADVMVMV